MAWNINNLKGNSASPNPIQKDTTKSDIKRNFKREHAVRRDTDKMSDFKVELYDIDETIINYMSNKLNLTVMDNGEVVKVPIIYGSPEKSKAVKVDGYLRDNQGKILLPAIMITRTNTQRNHERETFPQHTFQQVTTGYSEKNKYDRFSVLNTRDGLSKSKPTKQIMSINMPVPVICTYECTIWTDYVDQNNVLLQKIIGSTKDYWGDRERLKFSVNATDFPTSIESETGRDRDIKSEFTLTVNAYLLNSNYIKRLDGIHSTTHKAFTVRSIRISENIVGAGELLTKKRKPSLDDTTAVKDKPYDYSYTDGVGIEVIDVERIKKKIPDASRSLTIKKFPFHPAPKKTEEYGENGWVAYDKNYLYVYQFPLGWIRKELSTFDYDPSAQSHITGYDCDDNPIYTTQQRPLNTAFRIFQRFPDKFYQQVPLQSTDYGEDGWMSYDGNYLYIYADKMWRRIVTNNFTAF